MIQEIEALELITLPTRSTSTSVHIEVDMTMGGAVTIRFEDETAARRIIEKLTQGGPNEKFVMDLDWRSVYRPKE